MDIAADPPGAVKPTADRVVLVDARGRPCGTADREAVHSRTTPRHLAFSCWVVDPTGRILLTRRSLAKRSWAGVWTNSCCGHPRPGEELERAVRRRVAEELGIELVELRCVLPDFAYRAVDVSGVVENELCPVFVGTTAGTDVTPDHDEVAEWTWQPPDRVRAAMAAAPYAFSPWSQLQLPQFEVAERQEVRC